MNLESDLYFGGKHMLYKKVALIVVIVLWPLLIISCQSTINKNDYNVIVFDHKASSKSNWNATQIISSIDQLDVFVTSFDVSEYELGRDNSFFEEKSMLVCLFSCPYLAANINFKSLEIKDNILYINFIEREKKWAQHLLAIDHWICVIEIDKEIVKGIEDIEYRVRTKEVLI